MSTTKSISYIVDCDGMKYRYALHSTKKDKVIFPSQILNILEYCLFKKVKAGWHGELTEKEFPFNVEIRMDKDILSEWVGKDSFIGALKILLEQYYNNIPEKHISKD